ncbi:MAG: hypothetical protein AAGA09_01180 [Pseudomonadota bacterium]
MLRSLAAVIIATLIGLWLAKTVEGIALAMAAAPAGTSSPLTLPVAHQAALLGGWFIGAFAAAFAALLIARRWAPIGMLSAATIALAAVIAMMSAPVSWWAWPSAFAVTGAGGFLAIKLLRARMVHSDLRGAGGAQGLFK